jgi:hypothetical protein
VKELLVVVNFLQRGSKLVIDSTATSQLCFALAREDAVREDVLQIIAVQDSAADFRRLTAA